MSNILNNTTSLQSILDTINALPDVNEGVELPELTNAGTATDLLSGKQLIDGDGNIVEGTIPTKTSSNLTASGATVTVPTGYYASQATKSVATATQATPSITVSSNGLITASATQTAGYVAAGTKSSTYQLAFQAAKTITPNTTNQIAVSSGYYTGGNITVAGDANLKASNIKKGVSIFGINGTLEEGGDIKLQNKTFTENGTYTADSGYDGLGSVTVNVEGGDVDHSGEDGLVTRNLATYINDRVTSIGSYAFYYCSNLTSVSFPNVTTIGSYAFYYCSNLTSVSFPLATTIGGDAFNGCPNLTSVSFPLATTIGSYAFYYCSNLTSVSFPLATTIGSNAFNRCSSLTTVSFPLATTIGTDAFNRCSSLTTVSFPNVTTIGSYAFRNCYNLKSLYLTGSSLCKLGNSSAFTLTPIGGYSASAGTFGSIYVPASLLTQYQSATNWTYFSSRFVALARDGMVAFKISNVPYEAEEGMTWGEWVDSEYNTGNYSIGTDDKIYAESGWYVAGDAAVYATDVIINAMEYSRQDPSGSSGGDYGWE